MQNIKTLISHIESKKPKYFVLKKSLSERTHICSCGCVLDRDFNAAINILSKALKQCSENTVGHTGINASGEESSTLIQPLMQESSLSTQVIRVAKEESMGLQSL